MDINKIICSIIKDVDKGKEPRGTDYGLSTEEFLKIAKIIKNEGYIDNVAFAAKVVFMNNTSVTMKGYKFLEEEMKRIEIANRTLKDKISLLIIDFIKEIFSNTRKKVAGLLSFLLFIAILFFATRLWDWVVDLFNKL